MEPGSFNFNLIVQGLIAAILIGMFYTLWANTRAFGGIIGRSLRFLGYGSLFIAVAVIEKMLVNFEVIEFTTTVSLLQDVFNLIGLSLLAMGFSKLHAATRT